MGRMRLDTVSDFARRGYNLRITCGSCSRVVEANAVLFKLELKGDRAKWPIERIAARLTCSCGHRGAKIEACQITF